MLCGFVKFFNSNYLDFKSFSLNCGLAIVQGSDWNSVLISSHSIIQFY